MFAWQNICQIEECLVGKIHSSSKQCSRRVYLIYWPTLVPSSPFYICLFLFSLTCQSFWFLGKCFENEIPCMNVSLLSNSKHNTHCNKSFMVKQLILILSLTRKDGRPTANLFDLWQQKSVSTEIAYYSELRQCTGRFIDPIPIKEGRICPMVQQIGLFPVCLESFWHIIASNLCNCMM